MILFLLFLLLHFAEASDQGLNTVRVKPGDNVLLECHSPQGVISLVEWSRADLDSDGYIFFYRDQHAYRKFQHPSFVDRVELKDPGMKGGDVSVVVNHVTVNDTGTYECYVSTINSNGRRKRGSPGISRTIQLLVEQDAGVHGASWSRGDVGGPAAALIIVVAAVVVAFVIRHKTHKEQISVCNDDGESDEQLV